MKKALFYFFGIFTLTSLYAADLSRTYDTMIGITPETRSFARSTGTGAIVTSGSGTWYASASASWISVKTVSGTPPSAVAYTVEQNDGVEARVGYVYVSGHRHTITQAGTGASLEVYSAEFETDGGQGTVAVSATVGNTWHAKSNVDWITLSTTDGTGSQTVSYTVAKYDEVATRSGTLTIADNTFTVNQTGRRMKLNTSSATSDYLTDTIKIRVNALATTKWAVSEDADWITVTDAGNGQGGDLVVLTLAENASYNERRAVVTIGTETFNVRQLGRTDLVFKISAKELAVGSEGLSSERVNVTATPDLGWSAAASADWVELYSDYMKGAGNGVFVFKVKANPTLYARTATITVTAADSRVATKKYEISQEAAKSSLTMDSYEFEAKGEAIDVGVSVPSIVGWNVINPMSWITVSGASLVGPVTLTLTAAANTSVLPRSGKLTIADRTFTVSQKGRGVMVDYTAKVFDTDGKTMGANSENVVTVTAESDVSWTAVASDPTWIVIYEGATGKGNGTVKYIVAPYVGTGTMRQGTISIGDKTVYITQRPYDLTIEPTGAWVNGNAGAGEIQVSLDINGVLEAFSNDEWINISVNYNEFTGLGKVLYAYLDNNSGKTRTGKIIIDGEEYTLEQAARQNIVLTAEVDGHGGKVSGGGTYNIGTNVKLSAIADSGYEFSGWTISDGDTATESEIEVALSAAKTYTATFIPRTPTLTVAGTSLKGVMLAWTNVAWAAQYAIWRGTLESRSQAIKIATIDNDGSCTYFDGTGDENQVYWYWVEAIGVEDDVFSNAMSATRSRQSFSIIYTNLRGTTQKNPATYTEGAEITFTNPSNRRGYSFVGWSPAAITPETTGDVTVRAIWLQNTYSVAYDANGSTSEMDNQNFTYGLYQYLTETKLTRSGYIFAGWSTAKDGVTEYVDQQSLKNLSESLNGIVTLYAVWNALLGIEDDDKAVITGNEIDGFIIKPGDGKKDEVIVTVPADFDPKKITLEVAADVASVKPNGATLKIVKGAHDITRYLNIPAVDGAGRINLAAAVVKEEIVKDAMDTTRKDNPAEITLNAENPTIKTSPTKPGLTYTFSEGATLEDLTLKSTKVGDGSAWTPTITIKGGTSGFYSIGVTK